MAGDQAPTTDQSTADSAARAPRQPFQLRKFNRKIPAPSVRMHASDGFHYRCSWIQDSITVHSDGNVSCGLDDPNGMRSFGNIYSQTVDEIFQNPEYSNLEEKLWNGHRCIDCSLYRRETENFSQSRPLRDTLPRTLIVEPTVKCNIRCLNDACVANNDAAIRTRDTDMLRYDAFLHLIDQLKNSLRHVYFFNYGDPFVHAQAEDMLLYLRQSCPDAEVVTSTNGIPLAKPARALKVVQAGLHTIFFTIGGITQQSYEKYHVAGRVDLALQGMKNVLDARREFQTTRPIVVWRYLLFRWNDSEAEIDAAVHLAEQYGVDILHLYLTHMPPGAWSYRFAPGTPNFARYRKYMECALDYTRSVGLREPDSHGFFWDEDVAELGPARWTGYRATMTCIPRSDWLVMAFATARPTARERPTIVFVRTPWKTFKVTIGHMQWREIAIPVPPGWGERRVPVSICTPDYWFPVDELPTEDTRCLGVLVRTDDGRLTDPNEWPRSRMDDAAGLEMTELDHQILIKLDPGDTPPATMPDLPLGGRMLEVGR